MSVFERLGGNELFEEPAVFYTHHEDALSVKYLKLKMIEKIAKEENC